MDTTKKEDLKFVYLFMSMYFLVSVKGLSSMWKVIGQAGFSSNTNWNLKKMPKEKSSSISLIVLMFLYGFTGLLICLFYNSRDFFLSFRKGGILQQMLTSQFIYLEYVTKKKRRKNKNKPQ